MNIDEYFKSWAADSGHDIDRLLDFVGWPSEWNHGPYYEELYHVLEDFSDDFDPPLSDELIRYSLSKWAGTDVPIDHPLVRDRHKWHKVYLDTEYDTAKPADAKQLFILVKGIAGPELSENLGDFQELSDHVDSPDITGNLFNMVVGGRAVYGLVNDEAAAFLSGDEVKVFDFDGNRLFKDQELPKVVNYIVGGMKFSRPVSDVGELASLVGNHLADLVIGDESISILDLP